MMNARTTNHRRRAVEASVKAAQLKRARIEQDITRRALVKRHEGVRVSTFVIEATIGEGVPA